MKGRPERESNSDVCDSGALLFQFSFQVNWEMVIMWAHDNPQKMYVAVNI